MHEYVNFDSFSIQKCLFEQIISLLLLTTEATNKIILGERGKKYKKRRKWGILQTKITGGGETDFCKGLKVTGH